jgi:hypothetical protein
MRQQNLPALASPPPSASPPCGGDARAIYNKPSPTKILIVPLNRSATGWHPFDVDQCKLVPVMQITNATQGAFGSPLTPSFPWEFGVIFIVPICIQLTYVGSSGNSPSRALRAVMQLPARPPCQRSPHRCQRTQIFPPSISGIFRVRVESRRERSACRGSRQNRLQDRQVCGDQPHSPDQGSWHDHAYRRQFAGP